MKGSKAIIRIKDKPDSADEESHMAELTIQISDELAQCLEPLQNRLTELLWRLLDVANLSINSQPIVETETTDIPAVYQ
ncbi:hypothetical protein [Tolypothrix sp. VBCCA 56010]|uniref:hypothetical protein n=1 Tax=Tolypothrix sp. VBCCA 56010 TaxID=3137731 RepID=UPI003D7D5EAD